MKNINTKLRTVFNSFVLVSLLSSNTMLSADDTEVFYSVNVSKPNLLFVLDMSGSMNEPIEAGSNSTSKHELIREVNHSLNDGFQKWDNRTSTGGGTSKLGGGWGDYTWSLKFTPSNMNAVRFDNLGIPKNSRITEAYIQFTATGSNDNGKETDIDIYVEDSSNADYFYFNNYRYGNAKTIIGNHRTLYESVKWKDVPRWKKREKKRDQRTPNLKENIQRIIDKSNWQPDNGIAFLFDTVKGKRLAKSFDWSGTQPSPPEIHIKYETEETVSTTRLNVMKSAFRKVLSTAPSNVNVGLMKYSSQDADSIYESENKRHHYVSGITTPIMDINSFATEITAGYDNRDNLINPDARATVRSYLPDVVNSWVGYGGTPIVDALYEAALYFRGDKMHYGKTLNNTTSTNTRAGYLVGDVEVAYASGSHPSTYVGGAEINTDITSSGRSSITDKNYISPIKSSCQANYIVLMSDGYPSYYTQASWGSDKGPFAHAYAGENGNPAMSQSNLVHDFTQAMSGVSCAVDPEGFNAGTCGAELTSFLANHDQSPFAEVQTIKTFTVGFGDGLDEETVEYLKGLATYEGKSPSYYDARDEETLISSFRRILTEVSKPSGTLASPGYSVNIKNGLAHEKDIYIPVFDRKNSSVWSGNLKKFQIVDNGDGQRRIQGSNDKDAVDDLGSFTSDAHDYWSNSSTIEGSDGKDVLKGGVASLINSPDERKLYSNIKNDDLTDSKNKISSDNKEFIEELKKVTNADKDERKRMADFIRGWKNGDKDEGARKHMGDMLHSEPLIITYEKGDGNGNDKEQYLFAATNEGYLHVFDTKTGEEKFAFMPKELLKNIDPQFKEAGVAKDHKYGVDGQLSYWQNDDHVYVYFGLRRGGRSYYALDVTDLDKPKLMWSKTGGSGDLKNLGESWSKPYLARVRTTNGNDKEVVIVSGGYDSIEDRDDQEASEPVDAKQGNDIFIFDAVSGERVWSLRKNMDSRQIVNSIPGGVRALDTNQNGAVDRMYFGDTGGHIWRLDLSEVLGSSGARDSTSKLVKLASLGGADEQARKFYNEPDISVMKHDGKTVYAVTIGSGFRAHPMDKTIEDRFFVVRDDSPYKTLVTSGEDKNFQTITKGDLATIEMTETSSGVTLTHAKFNEANKGWTLKMPKAGEKILASSIVVDGTVIFTALVPEALTSGTGIDACAAPATYGRMYAIDIETGEAALDLDKSNNTDDSNLSESENKVINDNDFVTEAITKVIPDKIRQIFNTPSIIEEKDDEGNVINTECEHDVDLRSGKRNLQVDSYDACRLESIYWNDPQRDDLQN